MSLPKLLLKKMNDAESSPRDLRNPITSCLRSSSDSIWFVKLLRNKTALYSFSIHRAFKFFYCKSNVSNY